MAGEIDTGVEFLQRSLDDRAASTGSELWIGPTSQHARERASARCTSSSCRSDTCASTSPTRTSTTCGRTTRGRGSRWSQAYTGRWDDATRHAPRTCSRERDRRRSAGSARSIALGRVRARRGDPGADEAARRGARPRSAGRSPAAPGPRARGASGGGVAGRRSASAAAEEARAAYRARAREAPSLVRRRARVLAREGRRARRVRRSGSPSRSASSWRAQRTAAAARLARAGAVPYEAARALGEAHGRARSLLEALARARTISARRRRRGASGSGCASSARRFHAGPRRSTRTNPAALTARELEVLRLVAAGKRNAEIAERARRLGAHGRSSRVGDPPQASRAHAGRGGRCCGRRRVSRRLTRSPRRARSAATIARASEAKERADGSRRG